MFGSHLSIAGALTNALDEAESLALDTVQIFTKNQRQWKTNPLDPAVRDDWLARMKELGWQGRTVAHDSYLINLASPDDELWKKSINLMREEIERCAQLEIPFLVSHPGAHTGSGIDTGLQRIARAYKQLFRDTRGYPVVLCFENTAGGGSTLGRTFEELATLAELVRNEAGPDADNRIGFCFDTCHALAAGYDLANHDPDSTRKRTIPQARAIAEAVLDEFDRTCNIANLRVLHLNDSKGARNSRIDRHQHIGHGEVSKGAFSAVLNHPALAAVPKILETPKGPDDSGKPWDTRNLATLRRLIDKPATTTTRSTRPASPNLARSANHTARNRR
ncbi:MAG: deoxyribonuclease IV [Phycisphaeraceae bacterium]|nr:MAG: deoxyribonuclease IV [Phycisphaeraceae bacterium]